MVSPVAMRLDSFLQDAGISDEAFARLIRVSPASVSRYKRFLRVPRPKIMARIESATQGRVTPADFYGAHGEAEAAA